MNIVQDYACKADTFLETPDTPGTLWIYKV